MALYAACDKSAPKIVRAFVNNSNPADLPTDWTCVSVNEALVDNGTISVGMEWTGGGTFVPYAAPASEGPWFYAQAADFSTTSSVLVNVTNFSFQLYPNKRYLVDLHLWWRSAATTTGVLFSVNGPASPVSIDLTVETQLAANTYNIQRIVAYDGGAPTTGIDAINADRLCKINGIIQTGVSGGLLTLRARSEVNASQVTLRAGSRARLSVV